MWIVLVWFAVLEISTMKKSTFSPCKVVRCRQENYSVRFRKTWLSWFCNIHLLT